MDKTLILRMDGKDLFTYDLEQCDTYKYYNCQYYNIFLRLIRKMNINMLSKFFFGEWKNKITNYSTVIVFDNGYASIVTNYIKKKNPKCKIILWYWNKITQYNEKYMSDYNIDEIWSYDMDDCEKYQIRNNSQFYNMNISLNSNQIEYDVCFLGADKGRREKIEQCVELFKENGISFKIIIIDKKEIPYEKYLEYVSKSRCILEIVNDGVNGLTLRSLESICFNKKLITNNKSVRKYDFYNKDNIFILGEDDNQNINSFIEHQYSKIEEKVVQYYDFKNWLNRFFMR